MAMENSGYKDFLIQNKNKFGILEQVTHCEYLDICAKNVRFIASRQIRESIPLPSINHILNNCNGIVDPPGDLDLKFASFRVTCAKEKLVCCNTDRPGVKITIYGQIIVRTLPKNPKDKPSYMAVPVKVVSEVIYSFYSTKDGSIINNLKDELMYIDGSCMVVQLTCNIVKDPSPGCPRYLAIIKGNVVDKLWKHENIWVEGYRPYPVKALTICEDFDKGYCCDQYNIDDEPVACTSAEESCEALAEE